jgi:formamidopyrimidine-DNA glycosylase
LSGFAGAAKIAPMPELPDIVVYLESLESRILDRDLTDVRLFRPFLLRTVDPPLEAARGRRVRSLRRLGKRIAIGLAGDLWLVIHLMIAGRLRWREAGAKAPGKIGLAAFDFSSGCLLLTEAGTKRRASLHLVQGEAGLSALHAGGLELLDARVEDFAAALRRENHTLKRALTDPRLFSGIGNSYSDEILFRARLSPFKQSVQLSGEETARLFTAVRDVLREWTERLRAEAAGGFPEKVTAFHEEMAVHGRYGKPCVVCGAPVQRIVYAENEANYCARCQTGGRLLADRALSRLLKGDWPRTIEELEEGKRTRAGE